MRKKNSWLLFIFVAFLFGCYDDDTELIESMDTTHRSSELTGLIKSMTLHNASFDDRIDNSSCYSLVFPYDLNVNSVRKRINSIQDVNLIDEDDQTEILYPVDVVFYDYSRFEVNSMTELSIVTNTCEEEFTIEHNPCLNFEYPIIVNEFNEVNSTFKAITIDTNKKAFEYLNTLHDSDVYEIDYPVTLLNSNVEPIIVNSNAEFIDAFKSSINSCE